MSRVEQVVATMKKEIADILLKKVRNSRIGFISLTDIELAPDFSFAAVYYSELGSDEQKQLTKKALASAAGFIKGELGKRMRLRTVPTLVFRYDNGLERGDNVLKKLREIENERSL